MSSRVTTKSGFDYDFCLETGDVGEEYGCTTVKTGGGWGEKGGLHKGRSESECPERGEGGWVLLGQVDMSPQEVPVGSFHS